MSGRIPKRVAIKKRNACSNNQIEIIRIMGPGINSRIVGTIFLKSVDGVAM
jgi:hypothetical protein